MAYTVYYNTPGTILTYSQMQSELASLASANSWTYIDCGDSAQGNEIGGVVVNGSSYTKTVMVFGCIHGREKPAARGVLDWLNYMAANPALFPSTRFVVVPILNPDGYIQNKRKNDNDVTDDDLEPWPRQVDLNRNFDRFWGLNYGSTTPAAEAYQGPQGDSEPEAQVAQALFTTYAPDIVFDIHTSMNQIMASDPNYAPMKAAVDAAMTAAEFTPYPSWVMNYTAGTLISAAEGAGAVGYLLEFGDGEIHLEVNRCICALKAILESTVTFDSMNDFADDENCVAWLRHNSGFEYAASGIDWLEKNHFACLTATFSGSVKVEGDGSMPATSYPIKTDSTLSADFPFKYGTENRTLGFTRWYRPAALPSASAWIYLAAKYDTNNKRSFGLVLYNNAGTYEIRAFIGYANGANYQPYTLCTFDSLSANEWFFVGLGYEGSDNSWHCEIWDESAQIDTQDGTFGYPIYLVDSPWCIGCFTASGTRSGLSVLTGYIDEGTFFKEKLSSTKIASIWAQEYGYVSAGYSLTSDNGSFILTGQDATPKATRVVGGENGSFTLSGQAAGLLNNKLVGAEYSQYSLSGKDAGFKANRLIGANAGSYTFSGQDVTLSSLAALALSAEYGQFNLSWQDTNLLYSKLINASLAEFTLTGQSTLLKYSKSISAEYGGYSLTGQEVNLLKALRASAEYGSFNLSGRDATLIYTPIGGYTIVASQGEFSLVGQQAGLLKASRISPNYGSFSLSGQDSLFKVGKLVSAEPGVYQLSGQDLSFIKTHVLKSDAGMYIISGHDAGLVYVPHEELVILAETGIYTLVFPTVKLKYSSEYAVTCSKIFKSPVLAILYANSEVISEVLDKSKISKELVYNERDVCW